MENEKLTSFGNSFQSKIIASLLVKKTFLQTISDILQEEYFDSDANKWLVKNIIAYFYEFNNMLNESQQKKYKKNYLMVKIFLCK
mgnify:CR=1 FL=1